MTIVFLSCIYCFMVLLWGVFGALCSQWCQTFVFKKCSKKTDWIGDILVRCLNHLGKTKATLNKKHPPERAHDREPKIV